MPANAGTLSLRREYPCRLSSRMFRSRFHPTAATRSVEESLARPIKKYFNPFGVYYQSRGGTHRAEGETMAPAAEWINLQTALAEELACIQRGKADLHNDPKNEPDPRANTNAAPSDSFLRGMFDAEL